MTVTPHTASAAVYERLAALEACRNAGRLEDAAQAALGVLELLDGPAYMTDLSPADHRGNPYLPAAAFCERFAIAWGSLLSDQRLDVTRLPSGLLGRLQFLHLLVHGTAEGNLDACLRAVHRSVDGRHDGASLTRLLLLWVPGSRSGLDIFALYPQLPTLVTAQAVAAVAALVACTPETHAAREAAIVFLDSGVPRPEDYVPRGLTSELNAAWMRCSYASLPAAHRVKIFLNAVLARLDYGKVGDFAPPDGVRAAGEKPLLVVPLDVFVSAHAMYRCYAPVLAACRTHFRLLAVACADTLDAPARGLFDEVVDFETVMPQPGESRYAALVRELRARQADLVFYPSIGMSKLTLVLAQFRLAPVQAMTLGHPATSQSPVIDWLCSEEQWIVDPARYRERVLPLPRGTLRFALPSGAVVQARPERAGDIVRVAVPSMCQKWTLPFLQALQRVEERVGTRVEFHFFSGVAGSCLPAAVNAVARTLRNARVHPVCSYAEYAAALARCDLHAGTFPFGGTNSIVDSLLHGLPVLCMAPADARGAQDADFVRRAGLPEWLVAPDVDAWVDTLARLILQPEQLHALRAQLADRERLAKLFLADGHPEAFADALHGLIAGG